jgi:hypothetical protein
MLQRDYLMRLVAKITDAIARVAGLSRSARHEEAQRELDEAFRAHLGLSRADALRLAPSSLVVVIGPERAEQAARLIEAEAEALLAAGRGPKAEARRARAAAVRQALQASG